MVGSVVRGGLPCFPTVLYYFESFSEKPFLAKKPSNHSLPDPAPTGPVAYSFFVVLCPPSIEGQTSVVSKESRANVSSRVGFTPKNNQLVFFKKVSVLSRGVNCPNYITRERSRVM